MVRYRWTYEDAKEVASNYTNKRLFRKENDGLAQAIRKYKWEDLYEHMSCDLPVDRCIYVFEFEDNCAYIGLTYNTIIRNRTHNFKGPVYEHKLKIGIEPTYKILTGYMDEKLAAKKEKYYIKKYKNNGWLMLNSNGGGSVGSVHRMFNTKKECMEIAKRFNSREDFYNNESGCYYRCREEGWWDEISKIFPDKIKPMNYWTYEKCKEVASKYNNSRDFKSNDASCYQASCEKGYLKDISKHMIRLSTGNDPIWNYEKCKELSSNSKTLKELNEKSRSCYNSILRNGWKDELCKHMNIKVQKNRPDGYWTYEKCKEVISKCENLKEFRTKYKGGYSKCINKKWLKDFYN